MFLPLQEQCCRVLVEKDAFVKFLTFLLGPLSSSGSKNVSQPTYCNKLYLIFILQYPHRWNIIQVREFVSIFSVLSYLLRHTDISQHETDRTSY